MKRKRFLILALGLLWMPRSVQAQTVRPLGDLPTQGVYHPGLGIVSEPEAASLEKNPALLGWLGSWSLSYVHNETDTSGTLGGRGDALFLATRLPYLTKFSLGVGFQWLRPPDSFWFGDTQKFSLGFAWRPTARLTLGFSYAHVWSASAPVSAGIDTVDLAGAIRLSKFTALGLVIHDVPSPALGGLPIQRVYEPEFVLRVLGTSAIELGISARFGERRGDIDPKIRLWLNPYRGIHIKTELAWRRDLDLDGVAENDLRFSTGLELQLERVGISGFALWGRNQDNWQANGFNLAARISGDRTPALWRGPSRWEQIKVERRMSEVALVELLEHLRKIEHRPEVDGVIVNLTDLKGGWATAEELRGAFARLQRSRKHVWVFSTELSTKGYYAASAAEKIIVDPAGSVQLLGMRSTALFFRGTADKLGVKADFVRIAEYKSAPERFTQTESSAPAKAQRERFYDEVFGHVVQGISTSRKTTTSTVKGWIDTSAYTADEAKKAGLIDEVMPPFALPDELERAVGRRVFLSEPSGAHERNTNWSPAQIAVLVLDGDIIDGASLRIPVLDMPFVGARTILPTLDKIRTSANIQAVVIRINSPGGSAVASEWLAREVDRIAQVKPVICSVGDVAASGGYFLASMCHQIIVEPSSITGSIGIFAGKFDISGLAAKLGVTAEFTGRGKHAFMDSMWREFTEDERKLLLDKLRIYYDRFVAMVAEGRDMKASQVDAAGRGHVWSGDAARTLGLVDKLGGFAEAIDEAKRRVGINSEANMEFVWLPSRSPFEGLVSRMVGWNYSPKTSAPSLPSVIIDWLAALPLSVIEEPGAVQARLEDTWLND